MIENVRELKTRFGGYEIVLRKPAKRIIIIPFEREKVKRIIDLPRVVEEFRKRGLYCEVSFEPDAIICVEESPIIVEK